MDRKNRIEKVLFDLLAFAEGQICAHDSTHRGGVLWEICDDCGAKWADDMGGKPDFKWPEPIVAAQKALERRSPPTNNEHHDHKEGEGVKWEPGVDLPPVGEVCLYNFTDDDSGELWEEGDELEVIAHKGGEFSPVAVVWNKRTATASSRTAGYDGKPMFLPLQSHREKVIEAAETECGGIVDAGAVIRHLYEIGMLVYPGDDQ